MTERSTQEQIEKARQDFMLACLEQISQQARPANDSRSAESEDDDDQLVSLEERLFLSGQNDDQPEEISYEPKYEPAEPVLKINTFGKPKAAVSYQPDLEFLEHIMDDIITRDIQWHLNSPQNSLS